MVPPTPDTRCLIASAREVPPFAMTPLIPSGEYDALIMYLDMGPLLWMIPRGPHHRIPGPDAGQGRVEVMARPPSGLINLPNCGPEPRSPAAMTRVNPPGAGLSIWLDLIDSDVWWRSMPR